MKKSDFPVRLAGKNSSCKFTRGHIRAKKTVHTLVIGPPCNDNSAPSNAYLHNVINLPISSPSTYQETLIFDCRELWIIPEQQAIDLVVFRDSLSEFDLEEACRFIRHLWPNAKILVLRAAGDDFLEGAMYDRGVMHDGIFQDSA